MELGCQSNGAAREKISRHKSQALESYPNVVLPFTLMYYILFCCIILECLSKPVLWHYLLLASYWLRSCISLRRNKKTCTNCVLAVPGLTTIIFPMDMLTKILTVVNQLFLCSWLLESLHWEAKGVYNGHEPAISELMAITDSWDIPVKFIMFTNWVFLSHSNYKLYWESERVCSGHTWAISRLSAITNSDKKPKVHKVVFLSPLANFM